MSPMFLEAGATTVATAVADATTVFNAALNLVTGQPVLVACVFAPMIIIAGLKIFNRLKSTAR